MLRPSLLALLRRPLLSGGIVAALGVQDWGCVAVGASYFGFAQEGDGLQIADTPTRAARLYASPELLDVFQLRLLAGRWLTVDDRRDTPRVALISENLAAKHWPGQDPVGKRVRARDTQPITKDQIDRAVAGNDPTNSARFFQRTAQFYADNAWQTRFGLTLVLAFAGLAVALCLSGVYTVPAFAGTGRTAEFGVRLALGASPAGAARLAVRDASRMTVPGLALGTGLAVVSTPLVAHLLFGVSTVDPLSYGATILALAVACGAACLLPSWRAARVDPLVALRTE